MIGGYPKIWKLLPFVAVGLLLVEDFAPVSDSLDEILSGLAIAILFAFSVTYFWQERRTRRADQSSSAATSSSDQM
jgi:hypothetical protein